MIKVRLITKDSFTLDDSVFRVEVPEFTPEAVCDAYYAALVATDWAGEPHRIAAWHLAFGGRFAAFILVDESAAPAGEIVVMGFAECDVLG